MKEAYEQWLERMRAADMKLATYECPSCTGSIEALAPPKDQIYDSLSDCPHCEKMHFKVVYATGQVESKAVA